MFQDRLIDLPVFDEADDSHDSPTLRPGQGIELVDFLNEPRPVFPVFLRIFIGFQNEGNPFALGFFPFSPAGDTVINMIVNVLGALWFAASAFGQSVKDVSIDELQCPGRTIRNTQPAALALFTVNLRPLCLHFYRVMRASILTNTALVAPSWNFLGPDYPLCLMV